MPALCALQAGIILTVKITILLSHHSYTSYVSSGQSATKSFERVYFLGGPGGGGYSLIKSYEYVPPQRVQFLHLSSLKMRVHFAYFGLD